MDDEESVFHIQCDREMDKYVPEHLKNVFVSGCGHFQSEEVHKFREFLREHQDTFVSPSDVGRVKKDKHKIRLTDNQPVKDPQRRVPLFKRDILNEEIVKL